MLKLNASVSSGVDISGDVKYSSLSRETSLPSHFNRCSDIIRMMK